MNKRVLIIIISVIIFIVFIIGLVFLTDMNRMKKNRPVLFSTWGKEYKPTYNQKETSEKLGLVLSLEDEILDNSAWCGTFNLIWNDLRDDLAKQDIIFTPQLDIVRNLNKGTFSEKYLSEDSYYKVHGIPSLKLKQEIETKIKEKFNEKSDILNDFNWEEVDGFNYFLYSMLKKEFEFPKVFTELRDGKFGESYTNVKYFGIDKTTDELVRDQVEVLYYNSEDDFAIKLLTNSNDEIILSRGIEENTFENAYKEIIARSKYYNGRKYIIQTDTVKIPNMDFNLKEEIKEVENKSFTFSNGEEHYIEKAMQTIQFELNKKGGKIKSEAGIMMKDSAMVIDEDIREFNIDDTFIIFMQENDKELPYFAAKISNIQNVQENAENITEELKTEEKYREKYSEE